MKRFAFLMMIMISSAVAACGTKSSSTPAASTATITGTAVANAISGAAVAVKKSSDGSTIATAASTTGTDGSYSVTVPASALSSDFYVETSGGTYTDEATGTASVAAGTFSAHIPAGTVADGGQVHVTPASTVVRKMVASGKTFSQANTDFQNAFGYQPDTTVKADMASANADATVQVAQKLAGARAAAFSQLTKDIVNDPAKQADLLAGLADDLADGTLDGMNGSSAVAAVNGVQIPASIGFKAPQALAVFLADATHNTSGLTATTAAPDPVVRTATYKVTYVPGTYAESVGKTAFQLKVDNKASGAGVTGATITLTPTMHMSTMNHTTPVDGCAANATAGTYDCTIYYIMAGGGASTMGDWALIASINGETAVFFPAVGFTSTTNPSFTSGDTASQTLRNSADTFTSMGTATVRPYYIFRDAISGATGNHTLKLFIGARETLMSHKALYTGLALNSAAFTAATVTVQATTTDPATGTPTWTAMTEDSTNRGQYSLAGITGLTGGTAGKIYVRLIINGNTYTNSSTGVASGTGVNGYATFTITPP